MYPRFGLDLFIKMHPHPDIPVEERKGTEILREEIMAGNLSNLGKGIDIHNQEVQKVANERNLSRPTQKYTIIKLPVGSGKSGSRTQK